MSGHSVLRLLVALGLMALMMTARAEESLSERWFRPCTEVAAASREVKQWLDESRATPAIPAISCFLLYPCTLIVLTGPAAVLVAADLERYIDLDETSQQEGRPKQKAVHHLRSGPSTYIEIELDDAELLGLPDAALSFKVTQGSSMFTSVQLQEFIGRLKRHVPSVVIRTVPERTGPLKKRRET